MSNIEVKITKDVQSLEEFEKYLGKFTRRCKKDGFMSELRDRKYYKKPSEKRREEERRRQRELAKAKKKRK